MDNLCLFRLNHGGTAQEVSVAPQKQRYPVWVVCEVRNPTLHFATFGFWSAVPRRLPTRPDRLLISVFLLRTLLVRTFATKKTASESVASSQRNVGLRTAPYRPRTRSEPHVTESRRRGWSIPMRVHDGRLPCKIIKFLAWPWRGSAHVFHEESRYTMEMRHPPYTVETVTILLASLQISLETGY